MISSRPHSERWYRISNSEMLLTIVAYFSEQKYRLSMVTLEAETVIVFTIWAVFAVVAPTEGCSESTRKSCSETIDCDIIIY
jgi:hypothetical protein